MKFKTQLLHSSGGDQQTGALTTPIYQSSTFTYGTAAEGKARFAGDADNDSIKAYNLGVAVKSATPRITVPAGIINLPPDRTTHVLVNKYTFDASNVTVPVMFLIPDASFNVVVSVATP